MPVDRALYTEITSILAGISETNYGGLPELLEKSRDLANICHLNEYHILFIGHLEGFPEGVFSPRARALYQQLESPAFDPFLAIVDDRASDENQIQSSSIGELIRIARGLEDIQTEDPTALTVKRY